MQDQTTATNDRLLEINNRLTFAEDAQIATSNDLQNQLLEVYPKIAQGFEASKQQAQSASTRAGNWSIRNFLSSGTSKKA